MTGTPHSDRGGAAEKTCPRCGGRGVVLNNDLQAAGYEPGDQVVIVPESAWQAQTSETEALRSACLAARQCVLRRQYQTAMGVLAAALALLNGDRGAEEDPTNG